MWESADGRASHSRRRRSVHLVVLVVFAAWSGILPIHLDPKLFSSMCAEAKQGALSAGSAETGYCPQTCRIDERGIHHPDPIESEPSEPSAEDDQTERPLAPQVAVMPELQIAMAEPISSATAVEHPEILATTYLSPPFPPPKA